MANVSLTTLEELGWKPYWDHLGQHPIKEGDILKISPSETINIFWVCVPTQESDGKWYGNAIYMYEPIPSLVGGVYRTEDIKVDTLLFGGEGEKTLNGKVEEFAMWSRDIGQAGLQNYHLNSTGMIGDSDADRYSSISSAKNDELKYYYKFDNSNILMMNYSGEGASAIKSSAFNNAGGKHGNASILEDGDNMLIESMNFAEDFTLNFRFYLEKNEDFLLIENKEALAIRYDGNNRVFNILFCPYIGNEKSYNFEVPDLKVHTWYDFGIRYSNGRIYTVINGIEGESFNPSSTVGGYKRTSLDCSNVSKLTVFSGSGVGLIEGDSYYSYDGGLDTFKSATGDIESEKMADDMHYGKFNSTFGGGKNAMSLLYDKKNAVMAGMSLNVGEVNGSTSYTDEVAGKISLSMRGRPGVVYQSKVVKWEFSEEQTSDGMSVRVSSDNSSAVWIRNSDRNGSKIPNLIVPGMPILMKIAIKDTIVDQVNVFPKISIFPGTRIKVIKKEMTPPENENEIASLMSNGLIRQGKTDSHSSSVWAESGEITTLYQKASGKTFGVANNPRNLRVAMQVHETHVDMVNAHSINSSSAHFRIPSEGSFIAKRLKNW